MKYLSWNFIFSQPNNIESFKKNFHSYVSSNYIFSLQGEKPTISRYIKFNFLKCELGIFDKGEPLLFIDIEDIESLTKEDYSIKIGLYNDKKHKILLNPSIPTQNELIYILIMYMAYWKETQNEDVNKEIEHIDNNCSNNNGNKKEKKKTIIDSLVPTEEEIDIKQLIMIKNDFYVPSGIVLKAKILFEKKKKHSDYDRYIVLGNSLIGIFKDDTMTKLLQVIPLIPLYVFFTFNYETSLMKIGIPNQDLYIFFDSSDEMQIWQAMLYNIADGRVEEKISDETLTGLLINSPIQGSTAESCISSTITRLETQISDLENHLTLLKSKMEEMAKYVLKEDNNVKKDH